MTKAAIYVRVSTLNQADDDATSLELQEERCRAYATARGWVVVKVHREEGYTGTVPFAERPVGSAVMAEAELGTFERIITWNIARFARSVRHYVNDAETLEDLGVYHVSVSETFDSGTPAGRVVRTILVTFAEFEAAQIKERMAGGKLAKLRRGEWSTGPMSFGYEWTSEGASIIEEEAVVVRRIFELVESGLSANKTADKLNAEGYRTRPRKPYGSPAGAEREPQLWTSTTVARLVEKPGYMGGGFESKALGEAHTVDAPAIVSEEAWSKANRVLGRVRDGQLSKRSGIEHRYGLGGRVFHYHGDRAEVMSAKTRTIAGTKARLYLCLDGNRSTSKECEPFADSRQRKKNLGAAGVEAWSLLQMLEWLEDPDGVAEYVARHELRSEDGSSDSVERVETKLAETKRNRGVLVRLVASGALGEEEAASELASLDRQASALEETLSALTKPVEFESDLRLLIEGKADEVLDRVRTAKPGDLGPESNDWESVRAWLRDDASRVLRRYIERIDTYGPAKPERLDLAETSQVWAAELADLFDFRVLIGNSQDPRTWVPQADLVGPGLLKTSSKKVVRDQYSDLLMD